MKNPLLHSAYLKFRRGIRRFVYDKQKLDTMLRSAQRKVEPFYLRLNRHRKQETTPPETAYTLLEDYYSSEPEALATLLGHQKFSWQRLTS